MKKFMWVLISITMLGLSGCGSGSNEAKELLQRLLRLVGIPHEIVVNVCQDNNKNGFCESIEPSVSIVINKGDTVKTLWQKITQTDDGKYLLESYDPTLPILLQLKDKSKVNYDDGKFTLNFNGFEEEQTEKELSILESMVDSGALNSSEVVNIKQLDRQLDQDNFYAVLLNDLETNLNTLRAKGLTSQQAMAGNIKSVAEELRTSGISKELPDKINACNGNITCVEDILTPVLITDEEAEIINKEQRESNPANQLSTNGGVYDLWEYIVPSTSKSISETSYETQNGKVLDTYSWVSNYQVIDSSTVTERDDDDYTTTYTKGSSTITISDNDPNNSFKNDLIRNADIGKTVWIINNTIEGGTTDGYCVISDYLSSKTIYSSYSYSDLIELTCTYQYSYSGGTSKDIYQVYLQKNNGYVGEIDRDCITQYPTATTPGKQDDSSNICLQETINYTVIETTDPTPTASETTEKIAGTTWLKNEPDGYFTWTNANNWCEEQGYRLPHMQELIDVWNANGGQRSPEGFKKDTFYWALEKGAGNPEHDPYQGCAMDVDCSEDRDPQYWRNSSNGHPKCVVE